MKDTRCPGCGHVDCPRPPGWASLECDYDPVDALNDPAHVVPPPPPPPGRHRADTPPATRDRTGEGLAIYLATGETCLDCSSTALVSHWHTPTDCLVARTGWGGP